MVRAQPPDEDMLLTMWQSDTTLSGATSASTVNCIISNTSAWATSTKPVPSNCANGAFGSLRFRPGGAWPNVTVPGTAPGLLPEGGVGAPISSFASVLRNGSERRQYAIGLAFSTTVA